MMSSDAIGNDAGTTRTFQLFLLLKHDTLIHQEWICCKSLLAFHSPHPFFWFRSTAFIFLSSKVLWPHLTFQFGDATSKPPASEKASHCGKSWQKVSIWPVWNVTIRIHFWSQKPTLTESKVCHLANQSSRRLRWNSGSKDCKVLQSQTWNTQSHTIWRGIMPPIFASKHELLAFMDIQNPLHFVEEGLLLHVCPVTVVMHALCHNLIFSNRTKDFFQKAVMKGVWWVNPEIFQDTKENPKHNATFGFRYHPCMVYLPYIYHKINQM